MVYLNGGTLIIPFSILLYCLCRVWSHHQEAKGPYASFDKLFPWIHSICSWYHVSWHSVVWQYAIYTSEHRSCCQVLCLWDWQVLARIMLIYTPSWRSGYDHVGSRCLTCSNEEVASYISPYTKTWSFWKGTMFLHPLQVYHCSLGILLISKSLASQLMPIFWYVNFLIMHHNLIPWDNISGLLLVSCYVPENSWSQKLWCFSTTAKLAAS